jgi:uncharacterized protein (DUF924 family)
MAVDPRDVLQVWTAAGPDKWFAKDEAFDALLRDTLEAAHHAAGRGEHDAWARTPDGALALLLLLDQVPRNLYRDSGHAFATDGKARAVARAAVVAGFDRQLDPALRVFVYLPFEHSESLADQDQGVSLFEHLRIDTGDAESLKWALLHRDIIARFGRFPHRNAALGRATTPAERAFLDEGGFSG